MFLRLVNTLCNKMMMMVMMMLVVMFLRVVNTVWKNDDDGDNGCHVSQGGQHTLEQER